MIKISVELWPFGSEKHKRKIAEGVIYNDGTGDVQTGNYSASLKTYQRDAGKEYRAEASGFNRADDVWKLISKLLWNMRPEKAEERLKEHFDGDKDE